MKGSFAKTNNFVFKNVEKSYFLLCTFQVINKNVSE